MGCPTAPPDRPLPHVPPSCAALGPVGRLDPLRAAAVGRAELRARRGAAEADAGMCGAQAGGPRLPRGGGGRHHPDSRLLQHPPLPP